VPSQPPAAPIDGPATDPGGAGGDLVRQLSELLFRSSWRLRRGAIKELAPLGVTFGQARVLRVLADDEPMRMADLAASLEIVPRSVTSMIDSLVVAGLVNRDIDPQDRRSVLVASTAAGRAVLDRVNRARRATAEELFGRLSLLAVLADPDGASPTASVGSA
jgi:DNA-binding MarR family transcriptional regulator